MGRVLLFVLALCVLASSAWAGVYTFRSNDGSGNPADFQDLDHSKAYLWAFKFQPAAGEIITSATLSFSNIYNFDNYANYLGIYLIKDIPTVGGTTGWNQWSTDKFGTSDFTPMTSVYQKSDNQQIAPPFNTITNKMFLGAYSDTIVGSTTKENIVFDFSSPKLQSANPLTKWTWDIYGNMPRTNAVPTLNEWMADGSWALGIDPDCHFYNDGVTLTFTTGAQPRPPRVPEPMSIMLGAMGLAAVAGMRRLRK